MQSTRKVFALVVAVLAGALATACYVEVNVDLDDEAAVEAPTAPVAPERVVRPGEADRLAPPPPVVRTTELPPPPPLPEPPRPERDIEAGPTFTPFTEAPSIVNRDEIVAAMESGFPPLLKDAGIGGTVRLYFLIGADGETRDVRIDQSSGHQALDQAALRVGQVYRFSPAKLRGEPVPVWVSFPVTFQVR